MFTSKEYLHYNLGLDRDIAKYFVDRKVPAGNLYWKGKYLYVASGTGFLFIPLFFDLQYKSGISKEVILSEEYIEIMEAILHSAAMHEKKMIEFSTHMQNCRNLLTNKMHNNKLHEDLCRYFMDDDLNPYKNLGTTSKALNRADTFLFSLCSLTASEQVIDEIIRRWYCLIPSFLLMDDITDLKEDLENNEENAVNDFGTGAQGVLVAIAFLRQKFQQLKDINQLLGQYFEDSLERKMKSVYLKSLLRE